LKNQGRTALLFCLLLGAAAMDAAAMDAASGAIGYSVAGLYNLGNSYARAGKPGMAILNYERASLLLPGDPDVQANLQFVRASAHLPAEPPSRFDRIASIASPFWMAWGGVLGLVLLATSGIAVQLSSRHRLVRGAAALFGMALVGLTLGDGLALWPRLHQGIVIAAAAPVRVSPVPMGDPLFSLPEGEKVGIKAEHEGFALIETSAGRAGWIADSNVARIVPR
jgi:hypothetical protein